MSDTAECDEVAYFSQDFEFEARRNRKPRGFPD
jgi:hypothetical protein